MAKTVQTTPATTQTKNPAKTIIDSLIKLDAQADAVFVDMAAALYQAKKFDAHASAGFSNDHAGFVSFCDDKLKCGYRKAQYLIGIWEKALELGIDKDTMEVIGWGKMKELVPVITTENSAVLLKAAQEKSLKQLLEYIQNLKKAKRESKAVDGVNSSSVDTVKYTFLIDARDNDTVHSAIEEAKNRMETSNAAEAFVTICQDWMSLGGGSLPNTLEDYMELIERNFHTKVAIVGASIKTAQPIIPDVVEPADNADVSSVTDAPDIMNMSSAELKEFALKNGIGIPSTVKGKIAVRAFITDAMMKKTSEENTDTDDALDLEESSDDLGSLEDLVAPEVPEEAVADAEDITDTTEAEDDGDDIDLFTAGIEELMKVAVFYKLEIPKKLQSPKQLEVLRKHVIDTLKSMGVDVGDESDDLSENEDIVAAEEEKDSLDEVKDSLKGVAQFLKDKAYAEEYVQKFGKLSSKSDVTEAYNNTLTLISAKYNVSFTAPTAEEDDLL